MWRICFTWALSRNMWKMIDICQSFFQEVNMGVNVRVIDFGKSGWIIHATNGYWFVFNLWSEESLTDLTNFFVTVPLLSKKKKNKELYTFASQLKCGFVFVSKSFSIKVNIKIIILYLISFNIAASLVYFWNQRYAL